MLTKSAAKAFFLGGTALCSAAFLLLTLDTLAAFPKRSNQDQMTEQVVRGHHIWNKNNCMGCHTLMGEGGYYAPELTKVLERRGGPWINSFLQDPESFYPGRRKMIKYDIFVDAEVGAEVAAGNRADIIAFLDWVGKIDLNGFPAEPDMKGSGMASAVDPTKLEAAPDYFKTVCIGCHSVGGQGGNVGPTLDGVSDRFDEAYLRTWISDPQSVKPGTSMPDLGVEGELLDELVHYLGTL
ncbi:MAG: c-type cytochrome [Planctomycetota bacterium]|nr:c-type cytochrome [Planctomycetota bacterium]